MREEKMVVLHLDDECSPVLISGQVQVIKRVDLNLIKCLFVFNFTSYDLTLFF